MKVVTFKGIISNITWHSTIFMIYFKKAFPIGMKAKITIPFMLIFCLSGKAQLNWKMQGGISYVEHFSAGVEMGFLEKHSLAFLYGSNFFIQTSKFSSWMLQYERHFPVMKFGLFTPEAGIRGGYSVYTNHYYQWKLLAFIPYTGLERSIGEHWSLSADMGMAFSRALQIKRLHYGEVGWYKQYLPELKLTISYQL